MRPGGAGPARSWLIGLGAAWRRAAALAAILLLGGCGLGGPAPPATTGPAATPAVSPLPPTAKPPATPDAAQQLAAIAQRLEAAERRWAERGISSYRITVAFITLPSDFTITVTVRDGQLASHECVPQREGDSQSCAWANEHPDQFTVPGLFATVRNLHPAAARYNASMPAWPPQEILAASYDRQLGYPTRIFWQPPEAQIWTTLAFEELP